MIKSIKVDREKSYVIRSFNDRSLALRMLYMGIQPGQELRIMAKSPFGGCFYISVGDRWIAMRAEELEAIDWTENAPAQERPNKG